MSQAQADLLASNTLHALNWSAYSNDPLLIAAFRPNRCVGEKPHRHKTIPSVPFMHNTTAESFKKFIEKAP
jgi:hypothetical protein